MTVVEELDAFLAEFDLLEPPAEGALIDRFEGRYRFLSNFSPAEVEMYGLIYTTTEHAFQAAKTLNKAARELIRQAPDPGSAKRMGSVRGMADLSRQLGRQVTLRPDWDQGFKQEAMFTLLTRKFAEGSDLAAQLLATGDAYLVEGNHWHDVFWGSCDGTCRSRCGGGGLNTLGKMLMLRRHQLRLLAA